MKWEDRQPVVIQDAQRAISRARTCVGTCGAAERKRKRGLFRM